MATIKGVGLRWGTGITATGLVISATTGVTQNSELSREADRAELRNNDGDVIGEVFYNLIKRLSITVKPIDGTTPSQTDAKTNLDAMLVAAGTNMSITAYDNSANAIADHSGVYIVDSTRLVEINTDSAAVQIEAHQYDANDVSAAVT